MMNNEEKIIETLKRINKIIEDEGIRKKYWFDYPKLPVALYNDEKVFLVGYPGKPAGFEESDGILIGKKDERFYGNTAIDLGGQPVAIWDLTTISPTVSFERFLSLIFHEGFHGYQKSVGEKRWANDLQVLDYPFTPMNLAVRFLERRELLRATFADEKREFEERLSSFIAIREFRRKLIGDALNYELAQESVEGVAVYVETKAYSDFGSIPLKYAIAYQANGMSEFPASLSSFRLSCYAPGMCLAFLLDRLQAVWQKDYIESGEYIYDFLKKLSGLSFNNFSEDSVPSEVLENAGYILDKHRKYIDEEFRNFENSTGYRITLKGIFPLMGMDPMNILWKENYIINKYFFATQFKGIPVFLKQKSMVKRIEKSFTFSEVVFYLPEKPVQNGDKVEIPGIGVFPAKLEEDVRGFVVV